MKKKPVRKVVLKEISKNEKKNWKYNKNPKKHIIKQQTV